MQGADLAIIKDIPGYKIIMKAVLKHQIQQLVSKYLQYFWKIPTTRLP